VFNLEKRGFYGFSFSFFSPPHGPLAAGMYIIASTFSVILIINLVEREWQGLRSPELASDQRYFGSQELILSVFQQLRLQQVCYWNSQVILFQDETLLGSLLLGR